MPVAAALADLNAAFSQCDSLIVNTHRLDAAGAYTLPEKDRRQITVAAFLNMFIAWESYLERTISALLAGESTTNGNYPAKFASPASADEARKMLIGINRFFDFANHQNFAKVSGIYFAGGAPFQPHMNAIQGSLDDLRTMRNASAHVSSTTQSGLEALALRLLARPSPGIELYDLLTALDPRITGSVTVYQSHRDLLLATAALISAG
jgi:hypothetical protein